MTQVLHYHPNPHSDFLARVSKLVTSYANPLTHKYAFLAAWEQLRTEGEATLPMSSPLGLTLSMEHSREKDKIITLIE